MNYSTYSNFDAKDAFKNTKVVQMESIIKFPKYNSDKTIDEYATGLVYLKSGALIEIWAKIIALV